MKSFLGIFLALSITHCPRQGCSLIKSTDGGLGMNNLNAILLDCRNIDNTSTCEPQIFITMNFKPNLNLESQENLLLLDEIYEPTSRQKFKTMSPYVIIVSRSVPMVVHPLLFLKYMHLENTSISESYNERKSTGKTNFETQNIKNNYKGKAQKNYQNSLNYIPYAHKGSRSQCKKSPSYVAKDQVKKSNIASLMDYQNFYLPKTKETFFECGSCKKKKRRETIKCNVLSKSRSNIITIGPQSKRSRKLANQTQFNNIQCTETQKCQEKNVLSSSVQGDPGAYLVYNLSSEFPYLVAKIRIFKKRKKTWWMIMPSFVLNNLSGTFKTGNITMILKSYKDILHAGKPKYQKNTTLFIPVNYLQYLNDPTKNKFLENIFPLSQLENNTHNGLFLSTRRMLANCPYNNNTLCLKVLDRRVPAFSIKIKMPFRENVAQRKFLRVKVARIVTDATTKDALQISVEVINKGLRSEDYLINVDKCPLSETEPAIRTVKKALFPYISETITFLLPFIMGSNKNLKFKCELKVIANVQKSLNKSNIPQSKMVVVSRRQFDVETHSRCFCVWTCRCHCIGRIETHIDLTVCQKMKHQEIKDAGLLFNCPSNKDTNEDCSMDSEDFFKHSSTEGTISILLRIFGISSVFLLILLLVMFRCKCFIPRKEDLLVASTEWICQQECSFARNSNEFNEKKY